MTENATAGQRKEHPIHYKFEAGSGRRKEVFEIDAITVVAAKKMIAEMWKQQHPDRETIPDMTIWSKLSERTGKMAVKKAEEKKEAGQ